MRDEIQAIAGHEAVDMQGSCSASAETRSETSKDPRMFASEGGGTAAAVQALARASTANVHLVGWVNETMQEADYPVDVESLTVNVARTAPLYLLDATFSNDYGFKLFHVASKNATGANNGELMTVARLF